MEGHFIMYSYADQITDNKRKWFELFCQFAEARGIQETGFFSKRKMVRLAIRGGEGLSPAKDNVNYHIISRLVYRRA